MTLPPRAQCIRTDDSPVPERSWSYLPPDLLSQIANRAGLIELLSFRGVCKDWRSASSTASAQIESEPNRMPWIILHDENSQCILYTQQDKKYSINIPELDGSTCLSSNQGWLLLFRKGSLFFFCPFSGAKIFLPGFPHIEISGHVAAFSSPPTSEHCVVSVINRPDQTKLELNVIRRGVDTWTRHEYQDMDFRIITCATYQNNGTFYYMDNRQQVRTFSLEDEKWRLYQIVDRQAHPATETLPFHCRRDSFKKKKMEKWLELEEDFSVSTCGTTVRGDDTRADQIIHNEVIKASKESENNGHVKVIWIQPRFHQIPPNQSWYL